MFSFFFFNDTATTEIYTLSLHDALPISTPDRHRHFRCTPPAGRLPGPEGSRPALAHSISGSPACPQPHRVDERRGRSEEHTSELQSRQYLVCRLLLEKKKIKQSLFSHTT